MSRIAALLERLCPEGVEFKAIGEIAELVRGNGLPKSDFAQSGIGCIHYGQIYTRYGTSAKKTISFVPEEKAVKLTQVAPGDLIVTNTSENLADVCKARSAKPRRRARVLHDVGIELMRGQRHEASQPGIEPVDQEDAQA